MPNAGNDAANNLAKEIVQSLPLKELYGDAVSPAAKQLGFVLEDMAKTIRLVLAPIQATAILQDRFQEFIRSSIRKVPPERRIPPSGTILGPALEAIRFEPVGSDIESMFRELLRRSSDSATAGSVHPSYIRLVRDLSGDEAHILRDLHLAPAGGGAEELDGVTTYYFEDATFPTINRRDLLTLSIDRLISEKIIEVRNAHFDNRATMIQGGAATEIIVRLTPLGRHFISLVSPDP